MKTKTFFLTLIVVLMLACQSIARAEKPIEETESAATVEVDATVEGENPTAQAESTQAPRAALIDPQVDAIMAEMGIASDSPGAAVMVIDGGEIVHQKGYGLANLETGAPILADDSFHLGSVGKQFTALGVMMLHERGKLEYDDPIGKYIPELKWTGDEVTIRRLLHHTSGIPDYDEVDSLYDRLLEISAEPRNDDLLKALSEQSEFIYEPGSQFLYSNTGYDVLGALIERVSGQTYGDFMHENIFAPLGMTHSFALPNAQRDEPYVVLSYYDDNGQPVYAEPDQIDNIPGSGGIYSSLNDMYLYDQALHTDDLVKQSTLKDAFTEGTLNNGEGLKYGFAWDLGKEKGLFYTGHSGAWLGFASYYLRFPERGLSVVMLFNFDYFEADEEALAFKIADLYLK